MTVEGVRGWLAGRSRFGDGRTMRTTARTAAGLLALLGLGLLALVRIGLNLPAEVPITGAFPMALGLATGAPAAGLLALGLQSEQPVQRVGFVFAGVFGLLTLLGDPATLPATLVLVAVVPGIAAMHLRETWQHRRFDRALVLVALAAGGVLSLVSGIGIEPASLRPLGSQMTLLAIAATPVFVDWNRESLVVGILVGLAVLGIGLSAPFVTGAIALVVGGAVGTSLPLLFVGMVGAVVLFWASLRSGRTELALAAGILVVAGIPATVPRGLAFLTALTLLGGGER